MVRVSGKNSQRSFSPTTRGQEKKNRCYIQYVHFVQVGEKLSLDILFNIELMYCYYPLYVRLEFPEKYILTINVPVVFIARYVMVLRGATSLRGALEGVGPEN
jgi:hypothetical protein